MIIDSHQHYWKISRTDYGWLKPEVGRIYRDYLPEHLTPLLQQYGVHQTVVVQAAPSTEETEFMLQLADNEETIAGVVGWLDMEAESFGQQLNHYRKHPKFVGIRPMIQDLPTEWLLQDRVLGHLKLLAETGFPIDLQANTRHLPVIVEVLRYIPELHAVIDHLAKPDRLGGALQPWGAQMAEIAAYPNIMCKLSGMVPESEDAPWSQATISPFAEHVIRIFGKNRVMFGSDWPVCLFSATYEQVMELFASFIGADWTEAEIEAVYAQNAIRFYRLG
ncbi:amidohydrolase family protein [Paenibacillus eucommiae]|uniref:L-fuconolactonase n=1 Tax=Paenibacillus eucommiae TaxID=1355755 RepID=A0ABS4J3V5_9BACL|nr:amidohydrolase family protein [Paenibacillus eucommiae]MBP1993901.1 L-fuconolactonase [Paenibacillus eucommiae]